MQMSKFSLYTDERKKSGLDPISDIYSIIRDEAARSHTMDVSYNSALNWISRKVNLLWITQIFCLHKSVVVAYFPSQAVYWDKDPCELWMQGHSQAQLKECLEEYAALNVWQINPTNFDIHFVDAWALVLVLYAVYIESSEPYWGIVPWWPHNWSILGAHLWMTWPACHLLRWKRQRNGCYSIPI